MRNKLQRRQYLLRSIFSLWVNWATSIGVIVMLIAIAPLIPSRFVPLVALMMYFALRQQERQTRKMKSPPCTRILHIATVTLFVSAVIILIALLLLNREGVYELTGKPANTSNPAIPILITAPVTTLVSIYYAIRGAKTGFCRFCTYRNGSRADRGLVGMIYNRESSYQNRMLTVVSAVMMAVTWGYYWFYYINININRSDNYFFTYLPIAVYVLSLIFLGIRYYNMWVHYASDENLQKILDHSGSVVRYIVIHKEQIYMKIPQLTKQTIFTEEGKIDVPVKIRMFYRETIQQHELEEMFVNAVGDIKAAKVKVKLLYQTNDHSLHNNVFHCAVYIDDPSIIEDNINGGWFTLRQINELMDTHAISLSLVTELKRIYAISMAWKTYDRQGFRLYDIKHYKPTFRLRDVTEWDVDYNDDTWMTIAAVNQDKPFFRLRRFWGKYIKGTGV